MPSGNLIAGFHEKARLADVQNMSATKRLFTYTFHNFSHPYVGEIIAKVNRESLAGLYDPHFQESLHSGPPTDPADFFNALYHPKETEDQRVEHFRKELEVDTDGAYSTYNWELFFHIPLTVAVHLSKSQRFAEAQRWFHHIFDPTSNDPSTQPPARFWKFLAFRQARSAGRIDRQLELLSKPPHELSATDRRVREQVLDGYDAIRAHPFQPHAVARSRHLAYQYSVVMKYLDNLIAWGDHLFAQDTVESINEATQRYVLAANLLGPRPERVPPQGKVRPKTFHQLKNSLDAFGNALVELEGQFPFNVGTGNTSRGSAESAPPLFGIGRTLYFCIPQNEKFLGYWDTVTDRLFKIRHCMNMQGVVRPLALFDPPLDPGMLVKAAAAGIDVGSIVNGLNQPIGPLRCVALIQKALELSGEVRALGNALLSAIEKGEAEHLGLIRQRHEIRMQQLTQDVRFLQWKAAEQATQSLLTVRASALERFRYYARVLGLPPDSNAPSTLPLDRRRLTEENFDEAYGALVEQYERAIAMQPYPQMIHAGSSSPSNIAGATGGGKLYLNRNEGMELNVHLPKARDTRMAGSALNTVAALLTTLPKITINAAFWGLGASTTVFDGAKVGASAKIIADILQIVAAYEQDQAGMASRTAGHERRADEWLLQYNLAAHELMQNGRQILTSLIGEQLAHHEYLNTQQQIANAEEVDEFLREKFTNEQLHLWMQGEISRLYYEYYRFAFDIARKAERTMKHELMRPELDAQDFVKFNYWDGGRKGLLAGEAMHLDVKRMEMAYHDHNKRELELTRHVSLRQLDPGALVALRLTGMCTFNVPEWLFDRDCPGHYMRRIKNVAVSVPSVVGPYTGVHCTLTLLESSIRRSPTGAAYLRAGSEDPRFVDYAGGAQSIVTSSGTNDSGLFETNLRDERFLPFEGAGAISKWQLELPGKYRAFDYGTIADVILHIRYTARQGIPIDDVTDGLAALFADASQSGLFLFFDLRRDFPTEWAFGHAAHTFTAQLKKSHFPYFVQDREITLGDALLLPAGSETIDPKPTVPGDITISGLPTDPDANVFLILPYRVT